MITESACRQWGARGFRKILRIKGLGGRGKSQNRRERERDTGNFDEMGVSRMGFDRKEVECCSDTGKSAEKGVSRMGYDSKEGK